MKFSCLSENLSQSLSTVGKAVATRGSLPVLSNVLVATDEGRLKLAATNLETSIVTWVGAKIDQEGAVTIPARLLSDFLGSLPPTQIDGLVNNQILTLTSELVHSTFNGLDAAEFPSLPEVKQKPFLEIDADRLARAISEVVFCAASDEGRPVLTGIFIHGSGDKLTLAGVDGFRLAERTVRLDKPLEKEFKVVVPARTLQEVARLISGSESPIGVSLLPDENQIMFKADRALISSRLLEGEFPDYLKIVPAQFGTEVVLDREEFQKAVKLASVFAKDSASIVRLRIDPDQNQLEVGASTQEVGEGTSRVAAQIEGPPLEISFNSRYLSDLLSNLKDEQLVFKTSDSLSAGMLLPKGRANYFHLIMPVRVQG
ncbi:DNA polymerase III subunit beta [Candidatus Parcubacteria bacterium]|nr:DNA polymerase III subunit beta [Candidatus Parcubacteria bacterium]